jgi:hypothetical protein
VSGRPLRIVAIVMVHNEDVFVERAIRNVVDFCDRIHVLDHLSNDRTPAILRALAREYDHIDVHRSHHTANSHRLLEPYAGTPTWVIGVDGDELFDPAGLARLRTELEGGAYERVFRMKAHVLNCDRLDEQSGEASGWMAPPCRHVTKFFNFAALESWTGCQDKLEGGHAVFRPGYETEITTNLAHTTSWDTDPLRMLHVCFLRRSSRDSGDASFGRRNVSEMQMHRRGAIGAAYRLLRRPRPSAELIEVARRSGNWKREKFMRGDHVTVDARPFLAGRP